jgi:hypothetical protein
MPAKKLTATDPTGFVHTRRTHRTYTHVVAVYNGGPEQAARHLTRDVKRAEDTVRRDWAFHNEIASGAYYGPGGEGSWWMSQGDSGLKHITQQTAKAQAEIEGGIDATIARAQLKATQYHTKRVESGHYDKYGAIGWCGRPDLARKLQAQHPGSILLPVEG